MELVRQLRAAVAGTVADDPGTLALYATDASIYREVPQAVVVPRSVEDVVAAVGVCAEAGAPVVARGGGTSLAGNSIGGVVIDMSRHLTGLTVDPSARQAVVQPGVVLTDLKKAAAPHGLTFGPDPSSASRCTLGGMIGNNSCGSRSVAWGTTADNVERLDVLRYDGTRLEAGRLEQGGIHDSLRALGREHELLIRRRYGGGLTRQVSGYNLDRLLDGDLAGALVGSEGTCALTLGATVKLVELPAAKALLVLGFPSVFEAADAVPAILPHGPHTVEGINDQLVARLPDSARGGPGVAALPDGSAWLLIEVTGSTSAEAAARAAGIVADVPGATSVLLREATAQAQLWRVRADGAGLATRMPDGTEAWSGFEDAAVRPERLGSYLREFQALQDRYGYGGLVYGHYGEGCLHVRIDFDLFSGTGVAAYRSFVEEATDLVIAHGGSVSGEHGDGRARSELLTRMYGADLVEVFGAFKAIWDPAGKLNPGVLVDPRPFDAGLRNGPGTVPLDPPTVFRFDADGNSFARATRRCVGIGKCRQTSGGVMCPSYQVTRDEQHSTRGRAHLLWEMLRGEVVTDGWRSREVRDALDLCLSCKGCKVDCPVNVDLATYKSEFLHHHYKRRLRPVSHYSMGWLPLWARLASLAPSLANVAAGSRLAKRLGGIAPQRSVPRFPRQSLRRLLRGRPRAGGERLLLWPDTFTSFLQPEIGVAAVEVLETAGYDVVLPPRSVCCGLTWISTGQLGIARRVLSRSLSVLAPELEAGTTVVGLEPSCTAVLRDDAAELLDGRAHDLALRAAAQTKTFAELLQATDWRPPAVGREALVQTHCHQHAVLGFGADRAVLAAAGVTATVPDSGCCGLAGNFGFERDHYEVSVAAAERVLLPAVRAADPDTLIVADGFSCRTQIQQQTGREALHLAQVLRLSESQEEAR